MAQGLVIITPGTLTTREHSTAEADRLTRDQLRHVFKPATNFDLAIGGTPATREEVIHVAEAAGVVRAFAAGCVETGTATVALTFDLKKNGTTVLSAAVSVTDATADRASTAGTISVSTYVAGDVFTALLTATTPNNSTGPFAHAVFDELVTS
jgi:hypothetical protein